uniref:Disrupted in schizophrenia 1 protein n=1 Tax=Denticeps clupeoides TaxID=299321 RepID=A0AAY4E9A3_9TELE
MVRLESRYPRTDGGPDAVEASSSCRRTHRKPGYMRAEPPRQLDSALGKEHAPICSSNRQPGANAAAGRTGQEGAGRQHGDLRLIQEPGTLCDEDIQRLPSSDTFSSSFSFIQLSLEASESGPSVPCEGPCGGMSGHRTSETETLPLSCSLCIACEPDRSTAGSQSEFSTSVKPQLTAGLVSAGQTVPGLDPASLKLSEVVHGCRKQQWRRAADVNWSSSGASADLRETPPDSDSCSLDTEATSDTASASSITSGYESATPSCDQSWEVVMKKYEGVLQDRLQSNRTNTKIESMMLRLQRLQQKAVLEDDYDTAERFGKKLTELRRERTSLKPGLPSRHPSVSDFLERLHSAAHSALQWTTADCRSVGDSQRRREQLLQEKQALQVEVCELQARLTELQERSAALDLQISDVDRQLELDEVESSLLRVCSHSQLQLMAQELEDLGASEHRARISISPPPHIVRLQEQEQALSLSIKEATAKVVMSQRLGGSLRRKVSESETQLLALHEAKMVAISGNDFSSAKELKAEMKLVYTERDRLEALAKRLQALSCGSSQDLAHMKEQHRQVKQDLLQGEAQHEQSLKVNTAKYIELLEDRLHSSGSPALERIWEADLEACHLLLQGMQLHAASCCEPEGEEIPPAPDPDPPSSTASKEEPDCAMLTALGGRWCPEANLQHLEFTKKLEEFLFCWEDTHPEDLCGDASVLTEQCELIGRRVLSLEQQLLRAVQSRDHDLTYILSTHLCEVCEVKAVLQTMLSQDHKDEMEEEDEEEEEEKYNAILEEEQYFSDGWEI